MLKITFTVERRKPRPQQPGPELGEHQDLWEVGAGRLQGKLAT